MTQSSPQLRRCTLVTEDDIRALAEFLRSPSKNEGQLQRLLEEHTGIIGALGYCEFFSEYPVYKRTETEVLLDGRQRDRIDILAVKESRVLDTTAAPYKSPHIIELKKAHEKVLKRFAGMCLSDAAQEGAEQLKRYAEWLTTVDENRKALQDFGLNVLRPAKYLVMGTVEEFIDRPGLLEALKEDCIQTYGVHLLLIDDVLERADRMRALQYVSMECVVNLEAPAIEIKSMILASSGLAGLVMLGRNLLDQKRTIYGNIVVRDQLSEGLIHIHGKRLQPLARHLDIPFADAVVEFRQYRKMWKAVTDGIVVGIPDAAAIARALEERERRNTSDVRDRRRESRVRREAAYTRRFAETIRERFPSLPEGEELRIAARATEVGSGRVGRSAVVEDPISLAVGAHARWNYTDYPEILRDIHDEYRSLARHERSYRPPPADVAKDRVRKQVVEIMEQWSKPAKG
jgi:hypothetical protein